MEIIDAHAHIYERLSGFGPRGEARPIGEGFVEWATGEKEPFLKAEHGEYRFTPEKLIELMDEGGVSHSVLLQGSNYGFQNSYTAEAVRKYPDRFTGAGTLDPYAEKGEEIFENLTNNLNLKILKFELSETYGLMGYHPDLKVDGEIFDKYFSLCEENGITVVLDTGVMGTKSFQIEEINEVAKRHKNLTIVIAHTLFPKNDGNNYKRLELIKMLKKDNVFFDIARAVDFDYLRSVISILGSDRLAWGSDCPGIFITCSYAEQIDYICNSGRFTSNELENIMSKTARSIYRIRT